MRSYRLGDRLGAGGFGEVYRAELVGEGGFRKAVALKLLHPETALKDGHLERLRDEARVLGMLRHPALVAVDALTQLGDRWAMVLELVDGPALDRLVRDGPLPDAVALYVGRELAGALAAAHRAEADGQPMGLVHRDVKPGNVHLTPDGSVKLLDFGIAVASFQDRETKTQVGGVLGTPAYMAPERLIGDDGPESDVFALGLTLATLVTGRVPEWAELGQQAHEARIDALLAGVPSHWRTTLGPLLRWRPDERPTARDAEDALARELGRTVFDVRAWCREHAVSPPSSPGPLTGALLTEGADGELLAIAPQATGETGRMWLVVTAVVLLLLLLGLGGSVGAIVIGTLTVASQTVASGVSYEGCVGSTSDALDRLREAHGDGVDRGIAAAERIRAACPTAGLMGAASFATAVDAALEDGEVSVADAVLLGAIGHHLLAVTGTPTPARWVVCCRPGGCLPSLLALLLACGGNKNVDTHPTPEPPAAPAPEAAPTVAARVAGGASMAAPSPAYAPRAAGFARRFEEALAQPDANTATSGPSAAFVLGMLAQGATGETAAAYTELFGADAEAVRIDDARALAAYNHTDGVELTVVNGLWPDEGTTLDPGVLSNLEMDYRAKPNTVPLTRDPANAKATIDAWTRGNTNGMIEELFTLDQLDDARLVLANAVAFKGRWQEPFDPAMTAEAAFAAPKGPVQVQMMKKAQLTVPYTTGVGFAAVKLPYSGGTTSMIVVLPDEGKSLADAMDGLAADNLAAMAGARPMQVDLALPRFEIRTEHDLLQHAEALGLQGVLGPGAVYAGYGGLIVGSAIQKVVVAVSEEGTEAAAATGVALKRAALAKPVTFHADRPFLFAIWHEPTGTPLFLGQVVDPS